MTTIGLLGSYGGLNTGDEAILTSILGSVREAVPFAQVVVFSRDPAHTRDAHPADRVVDARRGRCDAVTEAIAGLDVLVLGGGGLLYDGEATEYLRHVRTAHRNGVPTVGYALGVGPLTTAEDRGAVREVVSAMTRVTVRDEGSKRVLEEVGVDRAIEVAADPALLLRADPVPNDALVRNGLDTTGRLIAVSVREPGRAAPHLGVETYHGTLAAVADFAVHRYGGQVVFVPMERGDVRESHAVLARMTAPDRARVLHGTYGPREVLGLMQHMDVAVGMRLHFLIFAALAGVPFLPLPYAGKVADFARTLGIDTPASLERDAVGTLLASVDRLWDERQTDAGRIGARIERLRRRSAAPLRHVLDVLAAAPAAATPPPAAAPATPPPPAVAGVPVEQEGAERAALDQAGLRGAPDAGPALSVTRG
ncbi:MAG: polysaccharide pyruvyl transferase family protein [Pseudonocardiales bacterium]|nr:polysaccharide pyruvyl transferase family protein [Pseudonocardiales bacterium]